VTTDLRLNEPRYIKLPDIMKAKKKPLDIMTLAELGVERATQGLRAVKFAPPPVRSRGIMVKNVVELLGALKQRGVL
jgi:electron transfer flavoprotein beta subunit